MPRIIPIKDLKNTSELSTMVNAENGPVYITKNGYGDMVIMSLDYFEKAIKKQYILSEIAKSEEDIKNGKKRDAFDALDELRKKHGL
ncbi:MAG: type II toxin-antitoxin system Phd/YefM family antitoxin [Firmicutes bacterium]|nr:type II toxin-antitoxin system Phd/YefM family antitoxin [Bacillota bacterium]